MSASRTARAPRRAATALVAALLAIALAACGSSLDPEEVAASRGTDGGSVGTGDGSTGTDGAVDPGTTDPGSNDPGSDPGTTDPGATDPGSGPGTTDPGDGGGDSPGSGPDTPATTDSPVTNAASCDGFKNGPGITDTTITIGNSSDISGPVPGLFETAQDGMKAFVAYFNASTPDGICGRKLVLKAYDSRTDAAADQQAYSDACRNVFAMIGSQSAFDSGGAATAQQCGLPDLRASSVTSARNACSTCFGVQAVNTANFENAVPSFVKRFGGTAAFQNAAMLYVSAGAAGENGKAQVRAMERYGMKFTVQQGIDVTEFNYVPYVQKLKDEGVQTVFYVGSFDLSAKLRLAMQQQGYKPKLYLRDPTDYNPGFVQQGGSAVDGTVVFTNFVPFEEAKSNREMSNYLGWLQQVKPGAVPQFFGVFSWSAGRLFVDLASKLGGQLTRESLIAATRKVNDWTAQGLHAPQPVGSRGTGECWRFIQLSGSTWKPLDGTKYRCEGITSSR